MKIILNLNKEEVEKLEDMIWRQDEGPEGMGWSSILLQALRGKVENGIKEAEKENNNGN